MRYRRKEIIMRDYQKLQDGSPITKLMHSKRWSKLGKDGKPIYEPVCELEGEVVNLDQVEHHGTLGRFGPNGNGYTYYCKKCDYWCSPMHNTYSALDNLFGFNQVKSSSGN